MERADIQELLAMTQSIFPNFKPTNKVATVNGWHFMLRDIPKEEVMKAFEVFCKVDTTGFAPAPSQILQLVKMIFEGDDMPELEAWGKVRDAIRNSTYDSKEEFEKLPEICKRTVGNHETLKEWAMSDSEKISTVVMSHFLRGYRAMQERIRIERFVPEIKPEAMIEEKKAVAIEKKDVADASVVNDIVDKTIEKILKK